jgi:shikimate dehydrogenase
MSFEFLENFDFSSGTKIAAVIGDPVSHSLSPHLHNYLLKKHKIDGVYIPLRATPEDFPKVLSNLQQMGFSGCNITIPHKETALQLCDHVSESAQKIGAVNTISFAQDGKIHGDNSDHFGFIQNIKNTYPHFDFAGKKVLILGAGGAARAIIFGLLQQNVAQICVANRNFNRAQNLSTDFTKVEAINWQDKAKNLPDYDIIINSTSLGMVGKDELQIDLKNLKKAALVCDIVYQPLMTDFLQQAQANGAAIVSGIGMLIHQGLVGFEKWFGTWPEIDEKLTAELIELSHKN